MSTSDQCRAMVGTQPTHPAKTQGVFPLLSAGHRTSHRKRRPCSPGAFILLREADHEQVNVREE